MIDSILSSITNIVASGDVSGHYIGIALVILSLTVFFSLQVNQMRKRLGELTKDNRELKNELSHAKKDAEDRYQDFEKDYKIQLELVRKQRDEAQSEILEIGKRIKRLQEELSLIKEANRLCDKQHEESLSEIKKLQKLVTQKTKENADLHQENKVLKTRIEILERDMESLKNNN